MNPFERLGLTEQATEAEVKAAWRDLARQLHPDLGGDPEIFQATHAAYTDALRLATTRVCTTCGGTGRVTHVHGFNVIHTRCPQGCAPKK